MGVGRKVWASPQRTRNRLRPTRIRDINELLEQVRLLVMIPVAEDDGVFGVVGVDFGFWVDDDAGAEAVDVLALFEWLSCE